MIPIKKAFISFLYSQKKIVANPGKFFLKNLYIYNMLNKVRKKNAMNLENQTRLSVFNEFSITLSLSIKIYTYLYYASLISISDILQNKKCLT